MWAVALGCSIALEVGYFWVFRDYRVRLGVAYARHRFVLTSRAKLILRFTSWNNGDGRLRVACVSEKQKMRVESGLKDSLIRSVLFSFVRYSLTTLGKLVCLIRQAFLSEVSPVSRPSLFTENRKLIRLSFLHLQTDLVAFQLPMSLAFPDFFPQHRLINREMTDAQ